MDPMAVPEILSNMSDSQAITYCACTSAEAWRYCLKETLHCFPTGCARSKPQFQNTFSATVTLKSRLSLVVRVNVVLNRTVVVDSD